MKTFTIKTDNDTASGLRKLSMIAGDGRIGQYLTDVLTAHVKEPVNQKLIREFDDIAKTPKQPRAPVEYPADHPANLPEKEAPAPEHIDEIFGKEG